MADEGTLPNNGGGIGWRISQLESRAEQLDARMRVVEQDISAIKWAMRVIAGGVLFASPIVTAILIRGLS